MLLIVEIRQRLSSSFRYLHHKYANSKSVLYSVYFLELEYLNRPANRIMISPFQIRTVAIHFFTRERAATMLTKIQKKKLFQIQKKSSCFSKFTDSLTGGHRVPILQTSLGERDCHCGRVSNDYRYYFQKNNDGGNFAADCFILESFDIQLCSHSSYFLTKMSSHFAAFGQLQDTTNKVIHLQRFYRGVTLSLFSYNITRALEPH